MKMARAMTRLAAAATMLLMAAPNVFAQGCAMCYTEAAAQGPRARLWLDYAILALLIPAVSMFAAIFFFALRRRDREVAVELPNESSAPALPNVVPGTNA